MNKALFDKIFEYLNGCNCVSSIKYVVSEFDYVVVNFNGIEDGIIIRSECEIHKLNYYM